jgi:hypothetical protein
MALTKSLATVNAAVPGLGKKLVPIDATSVRICEFAGIYTSDASGVRLSAGRLLATGLLASRAAAAFQDTTNQLPRSLARAVGCPGPSPTGGGPPVEYFLLLFANDRQRVEVEFDTTTCSADRVSNGDFVGNATTKWFNDLQHTTAVDPRIGATGPQG